MKRHYLPILCLILLFLSGCARVKVSQDYDTELHFPKLSSYDWEVSKVTKDSDARINNPLLHKRFHQTIDMVLKEKGFVHSQSADFLVSYDFSIHPRIESEPVSSGFGFGFGSYRRFGGIGFDTHPEIRQYDLGVLVIDIFDAASSTLLWRGRGSDIYTNHLTPEESKDMVNRLVRAILAQFPPM